MYKHGSDILRFEGAMDFEDLRNSIEWDRAYLTKSKGVLVVPDFYFLLLYGQASKYDIYYPYLKYIFDSPAHKFVLLSEVFEEMNSYFDRGKRSAEDVLKASKKVYVEVQNNPTIMNVVKAWERFEAGDARCDLRSLSELLVAYRELVNSTNRTVMQFKIINEFASRYLRPLERIYALIANTDSFASKRTLTVDLDEDTFNPDSFAMVMAQLITIRGRNKSEQNTTDARVLAKCRHQNTHLKHDNMILLNLTDGAAYQAAVATARKDEDRIAKNLRCMAIRIASLDANHIVRSAAMEVQGIVLGENGARTLLDDYPLFRDSHRVLRAGRLITNVMEDICTVVAQRTGEDAEFAAISSIVGRYNDFDDPRYSPGAIKLAEIYNVVANAVKYSDMSASVTDFDGYLENIWNDFVWLKDKKRWDDVQRDLEQKVKAYDIKRMQGPTVPDESVVGCIESFRHDLCSGKPMEANDVAALAERIHATLHNGQLELLLAALLEMKATAVRDERYIDAENIKVFMAGICADGGVS